MTRKGVKTGAKLPSRYEGGDGVVNFWLAILARAKVDIDKDPQARVMVEDFVKYKGITLGELLGQKVRNVDSVADAEWVSNYIGRLNESQ